MGCSLTSRCRLCFTAQASSSHCGFKATLLLLIRFKATTAMRPIHWLGLKKAIYLSLPHAFYAISFSSATKHLLFPLRPGLLRAFLHGMAVPKLSSSSEVAKPSSPELNPAQPGTSPSPPGLALAPCMGIWGSGPERSPLEGDSSCQPIPFHQPGEKESSS